MPAICDEHELQPTVFYPQRSGKIERWHKSLKSECLLPTTPLPLQNAQLVVQRCAPDYNTGQLQGAIGHTMPQDELDGRDAGCLKRVKHAPACDNWLVLTCQKWAVHVQHGVPFTRAEIPVHAEPM